MLRRLAARRAGRRDPLGALGERAARRYLRRAGYRVIAKNVRVRVGEADIVCLDRDRRTIVVVEVKARRRSSENDLSDRRANHSASESIAPEAAITRHKQRKLREITRSLVKLNGWEDRPVRIDVVAIEWPTEKSGKRSRPTIRHFEGAVGDV
jgi:putative endonuclease